MKVWDSEKPEGKSGRKYLLPQAEWRSGVEWSGVSGGGEQKSSWTQKWSLLPLTSAL